MTQQLLKKELYTTTIAYLQSVQTIIPQQEYEELMSACQSQAFLNLINEMTDVYADYLDESQLLYLVQNFKESRPILTALMSNMPAIVERMTNAFETLKEDISSGREYVAQ